MLGFGLTTASAALRRADALPSLAALSPAAWYAPSAVSTLFQDAAMSTPVTADGDPVGAVADSSGNGHHLTQGSAAARPLYRTDGSLHWLEFDGTDDSLSGISDVPFAAAMSVAGAFDVTALDSNYPVVLNRRGSNIATANRQPYIHLSSTFPGRINMNWGTSKAQIDFADLRTEGPIAFVSTCAPGEVHGEANALADSGAGVTLTDSGGTGYSVGVGFTGRIFGFALFAGTLPTASITTAKAYFTAKAGL